MFESLRRSLLIPPPRLDGTDTTRFLGEITQACHDNVVESRALEKRVYDLRRTHASLLVHEGVHPEKTSERLGHSSIKLTMDTYGHLFECSDRDAAEKMEKLFAADPKAPRVPTMPDRSRVADKTADKNTKARLARASK